MVARRIVLQGRVQGVGVRPAIVRLARSLGLAGAVANRPEGVVVLVEGTAADVEAFAELLPNRLPYEAQLESLQSISSSAVGLRGFDVVVDATDGPLATHVAPDRVVCQACLEEVHDEANRRYRYPFTSCTACGPRYSLIESLPYERHHTAMKPFAMCETCTKEHDDPADRRGHSQINACPECGPQVWWSSVDGSTGLQGGEAVEQAVAALRDGQIVALRGVGGYQLLADATHESVVRELRLRKRRPAKPLAVLVESLVAAEQLTQIDESERSALADVSNPIVILASQPSNCLAESLSPGLNTVGLLLPSTPLHDLIVRGVERPLVCTSGNIDGQPIEYELQAAQQQLAGVCDGWLHHDRAIVRPIDDSVVRVIAGRMVTIRLARGLAPLPLTLDASVPQFAVGGHMKCATAWSNGAQAVLGAHLGDQDTVAARKRFEDQANDSQHLYRFEPRRIVHDAHPEYATTTWAMNQPTPTVAVQHHHAHIVAGMLEHGWLDREVLGVAWDGTGWGPDGTIWGGEFLLASATGYRRVAHFRPFTLPGADAAIREPWRIAIAMASQIDAIDSLHELNLFPDNPQLVRNVERLATHTEWSPTTTSAGRLFDAAAVIILGCRNARYEGELAMRLESTADSSAIGVYSLPLQVGETIELDWRPLLRQLIADRLASVDPATMAMRLHRTLANAICEVCLRYAPLPTVVSGGVFQNRLLTELLVEAWRDSPQRLGLPGVIPPNDGGLAAGQLAIASQREFT
ncbi:MAG: carbamoyltransferase HypF [Planctomycetota bacterium]